MNREAIKLLEQWRGKLETYMVDTQPVSGYSASVMYREIESEFDKLKQALSQLENGNSKVDNQPSGDVVYFVAKAIADAVGNGMTEKYVTHAKAALASLPDHSQLCKEIDATLNEKSYRWELDKIWSLLSKCKAALSIKN